VNKYKVTANTHTIGRLKRRRETQPANEALQQTTCAPLPPHYVYAVWDDQENQMLEFRHLLNHKNPTPRKTWDIAGANEYGRLMQGIGEKRKPEDHIKGMNSMRFIHKKLVPEAKIVTYARFVADIRPQKDDHTC
jgi:hypothetical protein